MHIKFYLLIFFMLYTIRAVIVADENDDKNKEMMNLCYNSSLEGYRLKVTVLLKKSVFDWLTCVMECATEPCCRSINYKKTLNLQNEPNCEMLHNLVYDTSQELLEANSSYNHVYLGNPRKDFNQTCLPEPKSPDLKDHVFESEILKNESSELLRKLEEWLNKSGNWNVCWRGTRDGMNTTVFHAGCDGKIPTLIIVKVIKNNKSLVFGGYATESWAGKDDTPAPGSFLFSLRNNDDLPPFKASLKDENHSFAIQRQPNKGPVFGYDLIMMENEDKYSCKDFGLIYKAPTSYETGDTKTQSLLAGSAYFTPTEVEVLSLN